MNQSAESIAIASGDDVQREVSRVPLPPGGRLVLTVAETGMVLGVSRSKAYELVGAGEIPSIMVGRTRRVPIAALNAWLEEQMESAAR